jgi:CheY-like chemotaxis protein
VLAIDDDAGVITLLKRYLEHDGYQVVGVTHPHQAVDTARRLAPDLVAIVLDVVMPDVDGWQILRSLRQQTQIREVPIILCSILDGLERGREMGADAFLKKPVTRDEVLDTLARLERRLARAG